MIITNILEELKYTRKEVIALEEVLGIQKELCDKDPSSFAYSLAMGSLKARQEELNQRMQFLLSQRNEEVIKTRLSGRRVGKGTIPIAVLGDYLNGFQKIVTNIGQSVHSGAKLRGKIPLGIANATELKMTEKVEAASFGITLVGKTDPLLMVGSLLASSIECFFDLLNADNIDLVVPLAGKIGSRALNSYKDWVSQLLPHDTIIETTWIDLEGDVREWQANTDKLTEISLILDQITESEPYFEDEVLGFLLGASLIRDRFEFVRQDDDEKITGNLAHEAKRGAKECFGRLCLGSFRIETITIATGKIKKVWTLLGVKPIEESGAVV